MSAYKVGDIVVNFVPNDDMAKYYFYGLVTKVLENNCYSVLWFQCSYDKCYIPWLAEIVYFIHHARDCLPLDDFVLELKELKNKENK